MDVAPFHQFVMWCSFITQYLQRQWYEDDFYQEWWMWCRNMEVMELKKYVACVRIDGILIDTSSRHQNHLHHYLKYSSNAWRQKVGYIFNNTFCVHLLHHIIRMEWRNYWWTHEYEYWHFGMFHYFYNLYYWNLHSGISTLHISTTYAIQYLLLLEN